MKLEQFNFNGVLRNKFSLAVSCIVTGLMLVQCNPKNDSSEEFSKQGFYQLTELSGDEIELTVSPDGASLVFCSDEDRTWGIYQLNLSTNAVAKLTEDTFNNRSPRWSPDGKKLLFHSDRGGYKGGGAVWIMDMETREISELVDSVYLSFNARWSPDGTKVAFNSRSEGNVDVWMVNLATKKVTRLTNLAGDELLFGFNYKGDMIGYNTRGGRERHLYVLPVTDGEPVQLTVNPDSEWMPSWSPTENKVVYYSTYDGKMTDIWTVDVGSHPVQHTNMEIEEYGPTFSPDGLSVVFRLNTGYSIQSLKDKTKKNINAPWQSPGWPVVWSGDGKQMFIPVNTGKTQLYTINIADGVIAKFTKDTEDESDAFVPPNGAQVFFETARFAQERIIMKADMTGTNSKRLIPEKGIAYFESRPRLSADGQNLFYIYSEGGSLRSANVWKRSLASDSPPIQVTDIGGINNFFVAGNELILAYDSADLYTFNIIKYNLDEKRYSKLVSSSANNIPTSISSDGKTFLFQSNVTGTTKLYEQSTSGLKATEVPNDLKTSREGAYSPDGSTIVFVSTDNAEGYPDLYTFKRNSGEVTRLTKSKIEEAAPVFMADGKKVLFHANTANRDIWKINIEQHMFSKKPAGTP